VQLVGLCKRVAASVAVVASLAACANGASGQTTAGPVRVVAATNVWGDIAAQIGGSGAHVTSLISSAAVDPHEYEADVHDAASVYRARVVIENGASYDDFLAKLVSAGHRADLAVVNLADLVGAADTANPHLWYSPDYVVRAARAIEVALAHAAPSLAATFAANLRTFLAGEAAVSVTIGRIKALHAGEAVAYTEPLPAYLVQAAGLRLGSPAGFSKSLEDGTDPSPADSAAFERALTTHAVKAMIYNAQVTDPQTGRLRTVAQQAGVPVVPMTETLPKGLTFQAWQALQATALLAALDQA